MADNGDEEGYALPHIEGSGLSVAAMPGRLSEAYDVQKAVGKGGYAIVYKGIRHEDKRVVAVKKVEVSFDGSLPAPFSPLREPAVSACVGACMGQPGHMAPRADARHKALPRAPPTRPVSLTTGAWNCRSSR
jgi:hypothetical protein